MVIANEAMTELVDLLTYVSNDSPKNAAAMRVAVEKRLDQLRRFPRTGRVDQNAPLVSAGAAAYITTVKGVSVYSIFPVRWNKHEIAFVVTIRRGSRLPLEDPEYLTRWMAELVKLAPPPKEPSKD